MTVLTVNAGSNSLKAHLVDPCTEQVEHAAEVAEPPSSDEAWQALDDLLDKATDLQAVGHRLVHGGSAVRTPTPANADVRRALSKVTSLAPLHLPPTLELLDRLVDRLPSVPHVLCPDTAFHRDLPEHAATYALPPEWREQYDVRRYGFHGLSYQWTLNRVALLLDRPPNHLQVLMAHLGGGCSVCAVRDGRSVDTSMGLTPLDGLVMSNRSGAVDPGLLLWLLRETDLDVPTVDEALNHRSGLLGLSNNRSQDTRDLVAAAPNDAAAALALKVFTHQARRALAAAATNLTRIDALAFTGEIGWDQPEVRTEIAAGLSLLGIPRALSDNRKDDGLISPPTAKVPVFIVQPREELQLCRDTLSVL